MPRFRFNKLVRDKIPEQMIAAGDTPYGKTLSQKEYLAELIHKLAEEAGELQSATSGQVANELADIQEVVDALRDAVGITKDQLSDAQNAKRLARGGYTNRKYISSVKVSNSSSWLDYLRQTPDKYPEE